MIEHEAGGVIRRASLKEVVIVEHQRDPARQTRQRVHQPGQQDIREVDPGRTKELPQVVAETGFDTVYSLDYVGTKSYRIAAVRIERDPRERRRLLLSLLPLCQERRLAVACRSTHQDELAPEVGAHELYQAGSGDEPFAFEKVRRLQFDVDQYVIHLLPRSNQGFTHRPRLRPFYGFEPVASRQVLAQEWRSGLSYCEGPRSRYV